MCAVRPTAHSSAKDREAMAEPLFIVADIDLSAPALRRWLKSAPQSVAAFDDWPESVRLGAPGITELAAPWNPASPMRWSATAWTVSDGKMGICTAGTTSRRMRSGSRRASSMAMRPAPRRPRFSLRPAARAGAGLRQGSPHSSACSTPTTIWSASGSASSPRASCPLRRMRESRPMVRRLDQPDNLGDPGRLMVALFPPWPAP